jgi:hypothetical protein
MFLINGANMLKIVKCIIKFLGKFRIDKLVREFQAKTIKVT